MDLVPKPARTALIVDLAGQRGILLSRTPDTAVATSFS